MMIDHALEVVDVAFSLIFDDMIVNWASSPLDCGMAAEVEVVFEGVGYLRTLAQSLKQHESPKMAFTSRSTRVPGSALLFLSAAAGSPSLGKKRMWWRLPQIL